jgi:NAD(P)-dependent dehydrogenase (short-subunit alcohol dehydrogenase family)
MLAEEICAAGGAAETAEVNGSAGSRHQMGGLNLACAAIEAFTRRLAGEVGRQGVRVVALVGSRRIWPAHVGGLVDLDGSRPVLSDRLDDQTDDQVRHRPGPTQVLAALSGWAGCGRRGS